MLSLFISLVVLCANAMGEDPYYNCWSVSAASAMSDRLCIASNGTIQTLLSDADLTYCCGYCGGCKGGDVEKAWEYFVKEGLCSGGVAGTENVCKPYPVIGGKIVDSSCKKECANGYNNTYKEDKIFGKEYYEVSRKVKEIQKEIMLYGPVQATFIVFSDFFQFNPRKGVYVRAGGKMVGAHAVKIIGWGVENNTVPYWLIANSWGAGYGIDGNFKMIRGRNECGLEGWVTAGTVSV